MVIRCERCSTMYELDESLLAPTGSEVQCTKCQHVFTAFPPGSPGRTLVGVPAQPQPSALPAVPPPATREAPAAPPKPAQAAPPAAPATPSTPSTPSTPPAPRADGGGQRPVRTSAPAVYRPQTSAVPSGVQPVRAPVLKRDTVGTFEARLRWSARWRWLAPALVVAFLLLVAGAWALLSRRGDAGADRTRAEALALVALDDSASVEEAISRLSAIVKKRPKLRAAAADRALALVVRAAQLGEEAESLSARAATARDERERARREQPAGWQEAERAASAIASTLEPEIRAREERTRAVSSGAREQLAILQAEAGDTREVVRALAALHALSGDRDRLHRVLRAARDKGLRDPWIDLAEGWGETRDPDRAARERGLVKLGALAAARPDLVRGRFLLARDQLSLGRKAEALATVDGVLAANPKHEGALRLREELTAPPPQPPASAPPPPPPPAKPPPPARKFVPHAAPAPSPAAAEGAAAPAAGPKAPAPPSATATSSGGAAATPPAPAPAAPTAAPSGPAPGPAAPAPAPAPRRRPAAPPEPEQVIQGG